MFEKISENKESLKLKIQNIFSTIRNTLNDREIELLNEVDKNYNYSIINKEKIKEIEKLPNTTRILLERVKSLEYNWKNNKINILINDCINVENKIKEVNNINYMINFVQKSKSFFECQFIPGDYDFNIFVNNLKKFGNIKYGKIFDSKIEFDEELIRKWLNNRNFLAELLFRKTRDGSESKDFHKKCDNQGITIVFIETKEKYKFGGYTELGWEGSGGKKDKSNFLFSLNKKEKYISKNDNNSIYCNSNYGPTFGSFYYLKTKIQQEFAQPQAPQLGPFFRGSNYNYSHNPFFCASPYESIGARELISNFEISFSNSLNKGKSYGCSYYRSQSSLYTFFDDKKLTDGKEDYEVIELEVFKIIYI